MVVAVFMIVVMIMVVIMAVIVVVIMMVMARAAVRVGVKLFHGHRLLFHLREFQDEVDDLVLEERRAISASACGLLR